MPYGDEMLYAHAAEAIRRSKTGVTGGDLAMFSNGGPRGAHPRHELTDKGAKTPPAGTIPVNDISSRAAEDGSTHGSVSYGKPGVYSIHGKGNL